VKNRSKSKTPSLKDEKRASLDAPSIVCEITKIPLRENVYRKLVFIKYIFLTQNGLINSKTSLEIQKSFKITNNILNNNDLL